MCDEPEGEGTFTVRTVPWDREAAQRRAVKRFENPDGTDLSLAHGVDCDQLLL